LPVKELPYPENWKKWPVLAVLGLLMFVAGTVYSVAQAAMAIHRGDYIAATITGGLAVFTFGAVASIVAVKLRSSTLRGVSDSTGTTLRPDPVAMWFLGIALVGAVCGAAFYVIFVPRGEVDIPFTTPGREARNLSLMWGLLIIAASGLVALIVRRRSGYLRLAPNHFENADIRHTQKRAWRDVIDVTDQAPKKPSHEPIVFVMKDAKPIVVNNAGGYAPNGAALYWMIRHYWKHPEDRAELTDGRALERLRTEQFVPE
jgi:hypothetical protein